jgi:hypothetical protein
MKILQLFLRPSEKSPQRPPPNEDRSSMADLVRLLEAHAPKKEQRWRNGTGRRAFSIKCSNLERGESMKDPVGIFGCWRGFQFRGWPPVYSPK